MAVDNCKRCKKVFRKTHSPYCPECLQQEMQAFDKVYQFLGQGEGYIHLSEIAEGCGLSVKEVEDLFFSGKLGLAGNRISFNCQICNVPINRFSADKKRLCPQCTTTVEVEGKLHEMVDDKPKAPDPPKAPTVSKKPAPQAPVLKSSVPPPSRDVDDSKRYGFKRLSHD